MDLTEVCEGILKKCLGLKSGETFLVITDDVEKSLAEPLYLAGRALGAESMLMLMKERKRSGEEPPRAIAAALAAADAAICITQFSLTHTKARKEAVAGGTRLATMPGITEDMFLNGAITANYNEVKTLTGRVTDLLDHGRQVSIEKEGHRLTFSVDGRSGIPSTGVYTQSGESGNLPSGEAFIAPIEGTASGEILVDGSVVGVGRLDATLLLTVDHGRLVGAKGEGADRLLQILGDGKGRSVAEFGIGTNRWARITGNVLEDEKVYGTVHIAFGSNLTFGGTVEAGVHIDCVFRNPDVSIDGRTVMKKGEIILDE
ncbi:aminopeptidase [Sporolactobacillus pectinivorans]|uniref:aminopeptidase n=1 Tax=Sporolactobacillus pectinivorans TaxID=1591408 RepID=UPI000C26A098|nr:aminopeptidase [Sporolactobacillus pectinivorans]